MSRILCTFPGRHGDLLWALPTMRAISQIYGPVDLQIAGEFKGLVPILRDQDYLGMVFADDSWSCADYAPAPDHGMTYQKVVHLGYRRWPERTLPEEIYLNGVAGIGHALEMLDLRTPWISPHVSANHTREVAYGFTDCHFELKFGITELCWPDTADHRIIGIFPPGRWTTEATYKPTSWEEARTWISNAEVFLTDCSALHVLAVAMGVPVVIIEPMEARWNPIFYPLGMDGPQVTVVKGLDGKPTFDARHVQEVLRGDPDHVTVILSKPEGQKGMEEQQEDERDRLRVVAAYDAARIDRLTNDRRRLMAVLMAIVHERGVVRVHQDSIHHFHTIAAVPRLIEHTDPATGDLMLSVQEK